MHIEFKQRSEKLIKEYESKISDCDKMIMDYKSQIRKERQAPGSTMYTVYELISERKIHDSRRQSYVQFIKDIESLIE